MSDESFQAQHCDDAAKIHFVTIKDLELLKNTFCASDLSNKVMFDKCKVNWSDPVPSRKLQYLLNPWGSSHPVDANPQVNANIRSGQQGGDVLLSLLHHLVRPHHVPLQANMLLYHRELSWSPRQRQDRVLRWRKPIEAEETHLLTAAVWGYPKMNNISFNFHCTALGTHNEAAQSHTHFLFHWGWW